MRSAVDEAALQRIDLRLVPAAATGWVVTACAIRWPVGGVVAAGCAFTALVAALLWWWVRDSPNQSHAAVAAVVAAAAVVGMGFGVAVALRVDQVRHHPLAERVGTVTTVTVAPSESPRPLGNGRLIFRATLLLVDSVEMSGRVVVFAPVADFAGLVAGQPVRFSARVGRATRDDLTVAALVPEGRPTLGAPSTLQRAASQVRTRFADSARAVLPADQAAMLPALVLGDTTAVSATTAREFRSAGLTHLTAVSGANVTIVCGAVLLSARLLGPRIAVLLSAAVLVAFVVIVQPSASVLRAAVMAAIALLAIVTHRRRQAIPVLSATVLVLMIAAPELAVDIGFALSVSATAALIVIAPAWSRRLTGRGWPKPLADAVSVALAAQLVTAPLVAGLSGTLSLVSAAANIAVAVVIPPITVVGTGAAVISAFWPDAGQLLIRFTGPLVWWLLRVAHWTADLPGSTIPVPSGLPGVVAVAGLGVVVVVAWRWRWVRIGIGCAAAGVLAWTISGLIRVS